MKASGYVEVLEPNTDNPDFGDYYKFTLVKPETVTVAMTNTPSNTNPWWELFSEAGDKQLDKYLLERGVNAIATSKKALPAGVYFLWVHTFSGVSGENGGVGVDVADHVVSPYSITVTGKPEFP